MSEDKLQRTLKRLTLLASKWTQQMLDATNSLKLSEEEKDAIKANASHG